MDDDYAAELTAALSDAGLMPRPVAVLDLDGVDANLASLRDRAQGKPIRVASKSLRVRKLLQHSLAADGFRGVLAFTLPEALWLVRHGVRDIVVGYPTADAAGLRELRRDEAARAAITLMVDSISHLDLIDALAPGAAAIRVAIELDAAWRPHPRVTIGALRSPLHSPEDAAGLARRVSRRRGFALVGVMAYEGQIAGVADAGRSIHRRLVRAMKRRSAGELYGRRARAVALVRQVADLEFVNGGGTGSLETTGLEESVTEVAAGSGIVAPGLFDGYHAFTPRPALHVGLDVVRRPSAGVVTVLGGGWVASGVPGRDRLPTVAWPPGLRYARNEGAGEVQTPLRGRRADELQVGDVVWLRHAKAGELAERVNEYVVVRRMDGRLAVTGVWPTYRGEGKAFL